MIELRQEAGRAQKIVDLRRRALKARLHDLDGHHRDIADVLTEIRHAHRASAQLALEHVARDLRQAGVGVRFRFLRMKADGRGRVRRCAHALHLHTQDRMTRANLVAVLEVGGQNPRAVDISAVVAPHVDEPALRRVDFHHEVNARKILVLGGKLKMRVLRAADQEGIVPVEGEFQPLVRTRNDGEDDAHAATPLRLESRRIPSLWQTERTEGKAKMQLSTKDTKNTTGKRQKKPGSATVTEIREYLMHEVNLL